MWIKATASQGNSNCVELQKTDQGVDLRDSKNPAGPALSFTAAELGAFLDGAKNGEFDRLI
jgi:uncharacterized protein DUF397